MKLYDCNTAPSPRRVRIFIAEKGMQLETIQVDLGKGEQFNAAFSEINPDCVVPVLELDDGSRITEVLAICQYLEEIQPEPALIGRTPEERAKVMMSAIKVEQLGLAAVRDAFRNHAKGMRGHALSGPIAYKQIPELAERGRQQVVDFFERLERQLDGNDCVAGGDYSIADITALVFVDFAAWIKIGIPDAAVNLKRWYEAVSSRPSFTA
jgi:glutathione S-transferase